MWQIMPVIPYTAPYNWDLYTVPDTLGMDAVFETHKVSISKAYLIHDPTNDDPATIASDEADAAWMSDFLTTDEDPMEPISDYFYPVINKGAIHQLDLNDVVSDTDSSGSSNSDSNNNNKYNVDDNDVVALLSVSVYWRDTLKNILSEGINGLVITFENECNLPFTYQINGPTVKFLGAWDQHDHTYNHLSINSWLHDLKDFASTDGGISQQQSYTGRPLNNEMCPFFVTVYPSDTLRNQFVSNRPIIYAGLSILIFLFTAMVFVFYDWYVEQRHNVVNRAAIQNKTIVDTLFPEYVQQHLLVNDNNNKAMIHSSKCDENQNKKNTSSKNKLKAFLNDGDNEGKVPPYHSTAEESNDGDNAIVDSFAPTSKPIADLFPNTTVM